MLIHQQKQIHWKKVLETAKTDLKEWIDADEYTSVQAISVSQPAIRQTKTWSCLERLGPTWIKYNYDRTFLHSRAQSNGGWIIRHEYGVHLGSGQMKGKISSCALESELQALVMAMQNCWIKGFSKVIFEEDCKQLNDLLNGKTINFRVYNWIREVQFWKQKFKGTQFRWVSRKSNKPADILAKQVIQGNAASVFHYYVPSFILDVIHCDYLVSSN